MKDKFTKRRKWVNLEFGKAVAGTKISNKHKTKILRKLWKQAKKKYK